MARWRTDGFTYDDSAPEEERRKKRAELASWLREQFQRVTSGEKPNMRPPGPIIPADLFLHAPWKPD
jgi:hypothetical protein